MTKPRFKRHPVRLYLLTHGPKLWQRWYRHQRRKMHYKPCGFVYADGRRCVGYQGHPPVKAPGGPHRHPSPASSPKPDRTSDSMGIVAPH